MPPVWNEAGVVKQVRAPGVHGKPSSNERVVVKLLHKKSLLEGMSLAGAVARIPQNSFAMI